MGASLLALAKFIYYIYSENGWAGLVTHREYRRAISLTKILSLLAQSLSLCFKPATQCLLFSKMNLVQENRSNFSFHSQIYN